MLRNPILNLAARYRIVGVEVVSLGAFLHHVSATDPVELELKCGTVRVGLRDHWFYWNFSWT